MPAGDRPDIGGEDRRAAPDPAHQGRGAGVVGRRHHDRGAGRPQSCDAVLEPVGDRVDIDAGPDDVVAAADDADQVRAQREGRADLLVAGLGEEPAADREVGVVELVAAGSTMPSVSESPRAMQRRNTGTRGEGSSAAVIRCGVRVAQPRWPGCRRPARGHARGTVGPGRRGRLRCAAGRGAGARGGPHDGQRRMVGVAAQCAVRSRLHRLHRALRAGQPCTRGCGAVDVHRLARADGRRPAAAGPGRRRAGAVGAGGSGVRSPAGRATRRRAARRAPRRCGGPGTRRRCAADPPRRSRTRRRWPAWRR